MSSGSVDLGRSVLGVLENLTVTQVMNENEVLRHRENERLLVKVTGPNGTPVFYQVSLKSGHAVKNKGQDLFSIGLDKDVPGYACVTLSLNSVRTMEIWMGDTFLHRLNLDTSIVQFSEDPCVNGFDLNLINVPQIVRVCINTGFLNSPVPFIVVKIGPILHNDYMTLATRHMSLEQLISIHDMARQIGISRLLFRNNYIGDAISSLERFGISTTKNDYDNDNENINDTDNSNDNGSRNGNGNGNGNDNDNDSDSDNNGNEEDN